MKIEKCIKEAFVVIGKEGSTLDGKDFIPKLWSDANAHFGEVRQLAKKDARGNVVGIWGVMSDFTCPETGKNYMFFPIKRLEFAEDNNG